MKNKKALSINKIYFSIYFMVILIFGGEFPFLAKSAITPALGAPIQLKANADANVIMDGQSTTDRFGTSVSSAGDFNGDGLDDVIVLAFGRTGIGTAYIFFGQNFTNKTFLRANPDADIIINNLGNIFDQSVSSAGDFNGDGLDDVVIGGSSGNVYIFFGQNPASQLVLDAQTHADVIINGPLNFGISVASVGDFNGDGLKDIIVGSPPGAGIGKAYIFFGRNPPSQLVLNAGTNANVVLDGQDAFGESVSSAGDFNGDGLDDAIVGDPGGTLGNSAGSAFIFFGRNPVGQLSLNANANANVILQGQVSSSFFGGAVSTAGDFNGDGLDDVVVGAERYTPSGEFNTQSGRTYIFFGQNPLSQLTLLGDSEANIIIDGNGNGNVNLYQLGFSVASAGDYNNDGLDDVIIGARGPSSSGFPLGRAHVFFGRIPATPTLFQTDLDADVIIDGQDFGDAFARSLKTAGDFNGDGTPDIIIGAHSDSNNGESSSGSAFIFFSPFADPIRNDMVLNLPGTGVAVLFNDNSSLNVLHTDTAEAVATADVDGNGEDDVIVSFPSGTGPTSSGGTWISRNQGALTLLDSKTALRIAVGDLDGSGQDDLMLDFGADGLWLGIDDNPPFLLIDLPPDAMAIGDLDNNGLDDMVLSFTSFVGFSTFYVLNFTDFVVLDSAVAETLATADVDGNGEDDVIVSFPGAGTFVSRNQGALTQLDTRTAEQITKGDFDGSGQEDLLLDFGADNLWLGLNDTSPTQFIDLPLVSMASGDLDNNGLDDMVLSLTGIGTLMFKNLVTLDLLDPAVALDLATGNVDGN